MRNLGFDEHETALSCGAYPRDDPVRPHEPVGRGGEALGEAGHFAKESPVANSPHANLSSASKESTCCLRLESFRMIPSLKLESLDHKPHTRLRSISPPLRRAPVC